MLVLKRGFMHGIFRPEDPSWPSLLQIREQNAHNRRTVVWTNGCFDLLHAGHLRTLNAARALGDLLIVGLNSDVSVRKIKGRDRPIIPAAERAELLMSLRCVDAVVIFDENTPENVIGQLKPDIYCKGADYAPPHGVAIPERKLIESYGGKIVFLPLMESVSTTRIIERLRSGISLT